MTGLLIKAEGVVHVAWRRLERMKRGMDPTFRPQEFSGLKAGIHAPFRRILHVVGPDNLKKMNIAPGRASLVSAPDSIICRVIEACTLEVMRIQGFSDELLYRNERHPETMKTRHHVVTNLFVT
jgi:hypothetical protein